MFSTRFARIARRARGDRAKEPLAPEVGGGKLAAADRPQDLRHRFEEKDLPSAYMRAVYGYWCDSRSEGGLPPVGSIDPTRLPRACLPFIALLDVEASPLRFRTRLTGTGVVEALGIDHSGLYLDDIPGMTEQIKRIAWCARERRPYLSDAPVSFAPNDYKHYTVLTLPFGDAARGVERIMFVFDFHEGEASGGSG